MRPASSRSERVIRCAIYTRKSSDEGLEQTFNSLDAQREACAAYILSQASEGWNEVATRYDDGGLSGGTLERPALQQLLGDIAAGLIDIIVVYKVDRLTRSLLDFAKLVEAFDKAQVSFVSITQSFNTTTSMGRLTLNMLLSFAQFEREVTAERIRDKIAASKAKGMWMGGVPPIGYAPAERTLAIVEDEAALVRDIYRRYLAVGSVHQLEIDLEREGIHVPVRTLKSGKAIGGGVFSRGQLYHILKNATYVGRIVHRDTSYEGLHPALLDRSLWDAVQQRLAENVQGTRQRIRVSQPSLLAGRIVDEQGQALIASHACKGTQRYRYYVAAKSNAAGETVRIPARQIEQMVVERLTQLLADPIDTLAQHLDIGAGDYPAVLARTAELNGQVALRQYATIRDLVTQVRLAKGQVVLRIDSAALARALGATAIAPSPLELICEARLTRSGRPVRLIRGGDRQTGRPDPAITQLLVRAHRYWQILKTEPIDVTRLAEREGISPSYLTRILRLAFLAPDITQAMLAGDRALSVTARQLTLSEAIPAGWADQRGLMIRA